MIQLPEGFDLAALFGDLFQLAAPFAGVSFLIGCGFLIAKLLKKAPV